jgi:glycosyltransferase involved in cell wall biosynthesis
VIPVRNRVHTIADAVSSVLQQKFDKPFNVIVVDNHSTDGTTNVLADLAAKNPSVKHIIPPRQDLGIGGCWNEAVFSPHCGRYAIQLDSDDIYSGPSTIQKIVDLFRSGQYSMVIGSYKLVNMKLEEIPPGLIDHGEWTPENGRNNALRINGLGAPRAFDTALLRAVRVPNVSYGEDYAVALALSREYQIGRIFEPLYLCRRWEGNSDAALSVEKANRYDIYKDKIRTIEMMARQRLNRQGA